MDISVVSTGGLANAASQDAFCAGQTCLVQTMYDQSFTGNHLTYGGGDEGTTALFQALINDIGVNAAKLPVTLAGSKVYGAYFEGPTYNGNTYIGQAGYRRLNTGTSAANTTYGIATGTMPETTYMVTSGTHYNNGCCFDFGNAERIPYDFGDGTMQTIYFGSNTNWGFGADAGPWIMVDMENGLFAGNVTYNPNNVPQTSKYVTALIKGDISGFAIKSGDSTHGTLATLYDGPRPTGYQTMHLQGGIVLGIGGDNSPWGIGSFFEGCILSGYTTDAVDAAIQANIVAAQYT